MNRIVMCLAGLLMVCISVPALGQSLGPIEILPVESGVQKTRFAGKDATLYNYSWELKKQGNRVLFSAKGDNARKGAKRVEWTEKSVMELTADDIRTLSWVKESSGAEQQTWKLEYDWAGHRMKYSWVDRVSGKKEDKVVEFGADAHAGDAMHFMIRGFPFNKGPGTKISGEFVMTDGQFFKGTMIFRGEERVETAFGSVDAYKIEFKIGGALGAIAPKMFTWYTKTAPHVFVRYEGKEEGLTKPRTVTDMVRYLPAGIFPPARAVE